jgi:hypothetical protein
VADINKFTDYTAEGAIPPVDWTVAHTAITSLDCSSFVRARGDVFVPVFATPSTVYVCFHQFAPSSTTVTTLPSQPGVPSR